MITFISLEIIFIFSITQSFKNKTWKKKNHTKGWIWEFPTSTLVCLIVYLYIHLSLFIFGIRMIMYIKKNETRITHFVAIPVLMIIEWESGVENMKNGDLGVHNWTNLEWRKRGLWWRKMIEG